MFLVRLTLALTLGISSYAPVTSPTDERNAASVRVEPDIVAGVQVSRGPMIALPTGSTSGSEKRVVEKLPEKRR